MATLISFSCNNCSKNFLREKRNINKHSKHGHFCSKHCYYLYDRNRVVCQCKNCGKEFEKKYSETLKSPNHFCGKSCAAKFNNTHKQYGTRISKLELYLQQKLSQQFPTLEFHFNKKDTINSELDIFIPSFNLAFELNGIFHYEPIYGIEKLNQIQNNDFRKFQACLERNIELCIIDTSSFTYFKSDRADKFFNIIVDIISQKLGK